MSLFTWLVYKDRFPLAVPELLGELEAPTLAAAKNQAAERWPGVAVLIQSAASARVRPVTALPLPHAVKATHRNDLNPRGRHAKKTGQYHRQLDAFRESKRRAHDAAKRGREP